MLALSRNIGESIIINGNIKVTVVKIKGGTVVLSTEADKSISVDREEVHYRKLKSKQGN